MDVAGNRLGSMPTPVGPAPRDPDDPDFWDWGEDEPSARRHPARAVVAAVVVLALVLLMIASVR
jgi:hypothetical protein